MSWRTLGQQLLLDIRSWGLECIKHDREQSRPDVERSQASEQFICRFAAGQAGIVGQASGHTVNGRHRGQAKYLGRSENECSVKRE